MRFFSVAAAVLTLVAAPTAQATIAAAGVPMRDALAENGLNKFAQHLRKVEGQSGGMDGLIRSLLSASNAPAASKVTVFAPSDAAYEALAPGFDELSAQDAHEVLENHIVHGNYLLRDNESLNSGSAVLDLSSKNDELRVVNSAGVLSIFPHSSEVLADFDAVDIATFQGTLHVIDAVMLPADVATPEDLAAGSNGGGFDIFPAEAPALAPATAPVIDDEEDDFAPAAPDDVFAPAW